MLSTFRTYRHAVEFYRLASTLKLPSHLKDQLLRASSSVALNLAEGHGRARGNDQHRFFQIAFGSLKECQAILELATPNEALLEASDKLGAHLYRLLRGR